MSKLRIVKLLRNLHVLNTCMHVDLQLAVKLLFKFRCLNKVIRQCLS